MSETFGFTEAESAQLRQLLAVIPVAVYTIKSPSGEITYYNEEAARLWGRRPAIGELNERWCGSFRLWQLDGSELPHDQTPMAAALIGRSVRDMHVVIERPDGSRATVLVNVDPIIDDSGNVVGAINVFQDVTAQQEARLLFRRLVASLEDERHEIALRVHNHLGQQMTALRRHLDAWHLHAPGLSRVPGTAERALKLAEELDNTIDLLASDLRPASLELFGLSAALHDLVAAWSRRNGIEADFEVIGDDGNQRLPRDVRASIYRMVQEALQNVTEHADATHVSVILKWRNDLAVVIVEDNGAGFDTSEPTGEGVGLINLRERATLAGGTLNVDSNPGAGTTIIVRIPMTAVATL